MIIIFQIYLFEYELKLGSVQQQLKQNFGIVFGVVDDLILDLTQSLVVWIISFNKNKKTITWKSILIYSFKMNLIIKTSKTILIHPLNKCHF